jgi:hypothetical protein
MVRHIRAPKIVPMALFAALAFGVAPYGAAYADNDKKDDIDRSVVQQGFDASPIPKEELNLKGKDPYLVGLGSYMTFAGDCVGCHSFPRFLRPGGTPTNMSGQGSAPQYGDPFDPPPLGTPQTVDGQLKANFNKKHYLAGGRCFGSVQARNLTPDDTGRPRGLTEAEFIEAMRVGTDVSCQKKPAMGQPLPTYNGVPDGVCGLPRTAPPGYDPNKLIVMPFVTYHNLTDKDLKAIYAYLSSLPKATACNTAADGCAGPPGIGSGRALGLPSGRYAYTSTDECPNPPPPQ